MLRIIPSYSSAQAKSYFSTADYYREGQELVGQWRGEGAKRLGLDGTIGTDHWNALCDNQHPQTAEQLTLRNKSFRRIGYDFNFHVPKSVSVLHALTQDDRLLDSFRDAVRETMDDIEAEMQTRVRKRGLHEDRTTGNMVWGEFVHFTSRPVDEIPDPHLHAHCYVFNTTFDPLEEVWKAGQFGNIKRDAPYFEGKFHVRLAHKLTELGLEVERNKTGWEIAGITPSIVDKFSRRTAEIENEAKRKGITNPVEKAELGAKTRDRKRKDLPMDVLRELWQSWLSEDERDSISRAASHIGDKPIILDAGDRHHAIDLAAEHCYERQSVVPERTLLAESLKRSVGTATVEAVEQTFESKGFLKRERNGRQMVTTAEVLSEEKAMLDYARNGRGTRRPLGEAQHEFTRDWLNEDQRKAVEHVLTSSDAVMIVRGAAGVGKTSMLQEAAEAIEEGGHHVFTFAPSAKATGVLRSKGFSDADTVARLLIDTQLQEKLRGQVIWIDEAGMVGSRTMSRVFELADRLDARVILSGDRRQHGSVERGAALRLLEEQAGLIPAEIKEIQRQKDEYKKAIEDLSVGRIRAGFLKLDDLGWIREIDEAERYRILASDYVEAVQSGETALVISPTHLEAERCTNAIRETLRRSGDLGSTDHRYATLHNANLTEGDRGDAASYSPGDVLIFHQNAKGFKKGQKVTVSNDPVPVDQAARFQLYQPGFLDIAEGDVLRITRNGDTADKKGRLNNGDLLHVTGFDKNGNILTQEKKLIAHDFGHLAYGFCVTSHSAQGTDVQRVFVGQSADSFPASSPEQFYVSASRGQKQVVIYTDNKLELLDAVCQTDERLSATELMTSGTIAPHFEASRERDHDRSGEGHREGRKRDEFAYDR